MSGPDRRQCMSRILGSYRREMTISDRVRVGPRPYGRESSLSNDHPLRAGTAFQKFCTSAMLERG